MKIAAITDDGKTISQHFGRAQHYLVSTVVGGKVVATDLRDKMGHSQFSQEEHGHDHHDPRGHGFGEDADRKHALMIAAIKDCSVVLVRGMGRGAYLSMQAAGITPVVTDIEDIDTAVQAYIDGEIIDHSERLH